MACKCSASRQCPRQGTHPSKYCSYLPPPPTSGRGPGTWFQGHAPHLKDRGNAYGNACDSSASWNRCWLRGRRAGECRIRPGRNGSAHRQADGMCYRKTNTIKLSTLNMCRLVHFGYASIKLEKREKGAGQSPTTSKVYCWSTALGKAGFNEKIQLGSKLKETQSTLRGTRRFSRTCRGRAAHPGTVKTLPTAL